MWQVLQSVTGITKCDSYYKVWQALQSVTGITKCDSYYKVRQVLQSVMIITKCVRTLNVVGDGLEPCKGLGVLAGFVRANAP